MIKNLAILVVVMIFGFELYISTKGSQHRKKKRIKGGNILSTEKKRDERTGKSYVELIIETTTGRTVTEKDGIFSIYEVGEEVLLQEKDGYHRFIGNDRVDKIGRKELLLGLIPMVAIIGIAAILSFVI